MTALVIDASIAISMVAGDEADPVADAALDAIGAAGAICPALWWIEIRNVLIMMERRGRLSASETTAALGLFEAFPITLDHGAQSDGVLGLARTHGLSAYDALYLELALRRQTPLATLDRRLAAAAAAEERLWAPT